jgi:hypothetical protein
MDIEKRSKKDEKNAQENDRKKTTQLLHPALSPHGHEARDSSLTEGAHAPHTIIPRSGLSKARPIPNVAEVPLVDPPPPLQHKLGLEGFDVLRVRIDGTQCHLGILLVELPLVPEPLRPRLRFCERRPKAFILCPKARILGVYNGDQLLVLRYQLVGETKGLVDGSTSSTGTRGRVCSQVAEDPGCKLVPFRCVGKQLFLPRWGRLVDETGRGALFLLDCFSTKALEEVGENELFTMV